MVTPSHRRRPTPCLETLEDRCLMAGDLDPAFNGTGFNFIGFGLDPGGSSFDVAADVTVLPDGRSVVVGQVDRGGGDFDFGVVRLSGDGSPDVSFGGVGDDTPGTLVLPLNFGGDDADRPAAVVADAQGRLLIAGTSTIAAGDTDVVVVRLTDAGRPDLSFGDRGVVRIGYAAGSQDAGADLAVAADGKIYVASTTTPAGSSNSDFALWRLNDDGRVDTAFGDGGSAKLAFDLGAANRDVASGVALLDGDAIVVGSVQNPVAGAPVSDFGIARFTSSGTLRTGFGNGGRVVLSPTGSGQEHAFDVVADAQRIVVVGSATRQGDGLRDFAVAAVRSDTGETDATFGATGVQFLDFGGDDVAFAVARDRLGRLVVAGGTTEAGELANASSANAAVARLNADGSLDATFGSGGGVRFPLAQTPAGWIRGVAVDPVGGGIVLGGSVGDSVTDGPNADASFVVARLAEERTFALEVPLTGEIAFQRGSVIHIDSDLDGFTDLTLSAGRDGRVLVADWNGDGQSDLILYAGNTFFIDTDLDGTADEQFVFGSGIDQQAFVADFDGDGRVDPVLYDTSGTVSVWLIDTDRDGAADTTVNYGIPGDLPYVGDWDGNGTLDLGLYRDGAANGGPPFMQFFFDTAGDGGVGEMELWFGVPGDRPFLGDIDGDGRLDAGVFRLARIGDIVANQYFFDLARDGGRAEAELWIGGARAGDRGVFLPPGASLADAFAFHADAMPQPSDGAFGGLAGVGPQTSETPQVTVANVRGRPVIVNVDVRGGRATTRTDLIDLAMMDDMF